MVPLKNEIKFQFFEIMEDNLIKKILRYLDVNELIKFATLSQQARKILPSFIRSIEYDEQLENLDSEMN